MKITDLRKTAKNMKINIRNKDGEYRTKESLLRSINNKIIKGGGNDVKTQNKFETIPLEENGERERRAKNEHISNILGSKHSFDIKNKIICNRYAELFGLESIDSLLRSIVERANIVIYTFINYNELIKIFRIYSILYFYNYYLLHEFMDKSKFNEYMRKMLDKVIGKYIEIIKTIIGQGNLTYDKYLADIDKIFIIQFCIKNKTNPLLNKAIKNKNNNTGIAIVRTLITKISSCYLLTNKDIDNEIIKIDSQINEEAKKELIPLKKIYDILVYIIEDETSIPVSEFKLRELAPYLER